jgi:hypothetical protein
MGITMNNLSNSKALDLKLEQGEQLLYTKAKQQPLEVDHTITKCLTQITQFTQTLSNNFDYDYDFDKHEIIPSTPNITKASKEEVIQDKTNEIIKIFFIDLFPDKTEAGLVTDYLTHDKQTETLIRLTRGNVESSPEFQIENLKQQKASLMQGFENFFKNESWRKNQSDGNLFEKITDEVNQIPENSPRINKIKTNLISFFKAVNGDTKNISRELIAKNKINELNSAAISNSPIDLSRTLAKFLSSVVKYYDANQNNEIKIQKIDQEIEKLQFQQTFNNKNTKKENVAQPQQPAVKNPSKIKQFFYPIQQAFKRLWDFFTK